MSSPTDKLTNRQKRLLDKAIKKVVKQYHEVLIRLADA